MFKKILLINTKVSSLEDMNFIKRKVWKRVYCKTPPLGLMWLQAYLKKKEYEVKVFDRYVNNSLEELGGLVENFQPDVIGFSATTPGVSDAKKVLNELNGKYDFISVLGGAHISSDPDSFLDMDFDYGIVGEGEIASKELMEFLNGNRKIEAVSNLVYEENGELGMNETTRLESLDHVKMPDYSDINLENYSLSPTSYKRSNNIDIIISRGCPFQCTFCDRSVFGNKVTYRGLENIKKQINFLETNKGIEEIRFFDDTFSLNKDLVINLSEFLKDKDIIWTCLTRVDQIDRELLLKMKEAGCYQLCLGIEAADNRILEKFKKGITVEQCKEVIELVKDVGLEVRASFIVGSPYETKETLKKTLSFAVNNKIDFVSFGLFNNFPGAEIYDQFKGEAELEGYEGFHKRSHSFTPDGMSEDEFDQYVSKMYRKFYLRKGYIWKRIKSLESFDQIGGYFYAFLYNFLF